MKNVVASQQYSHCGAYGFGRRTKHNRFGLRSFPIFPIFPRHFRCAGAGSRHYCTHAFTIPFLVSIKSNVVRCIEAFTIHISASTKNEHIKLDLALNRFDQLKPIFVLIVRLYASLRRSICA